MIKLTIDRNKMPDHIILYESKIDGCNAVWRIGGNCDHGWNGEKDIEKAAKVNLKEYKHMIRLPDDNPLVKQIWQWLENPRKNYHWWTNFEHMPDKIIVLHTKKRPLSLNNYDYFEDSL